MQAFLFLTGKGYDDPSSSAVAARDASTILVSVVAKTGLCDGRRFIHPNEGEQDKDGDMKKLSVLSIGMSALLAVTLPLMAQAPGPSHFARPTVVVAPGPQNPSGPTGIVPALYRAAYGFTLIPNQGQGQTIAVIGAYDDPNIASDLAFYANYFHLAPCNFQKVKLGTIQGEGWDLLESLGVEQACALVPHANIVLIEAASNGFTDLLVAIALASSAPYNATVVSMGWGFGEFSGQQDYDVYFCNIVNGLGQPVTFVAAEGPTCGSVFYPAASSCVVAVGGTTLALAAESACTSRNRRGRTRLARSTPPPTAVCPTLPRTPTRPLAFLCTTPTVTAVGSKSAAPACPLRTGRHSLL
jgi:hypothetical protein